MATFSVRYLDWDRAKLTGAEKVPYEEWLTLDNVFDTFQEAKAFAADYEKQHTPYERKLNPDYDPYGYNYAPRYINVPCEGADPRYKFMAYKLPENMDHVAREAARVAAGEYEPLPKHMQPEGRYYSYIHARLILAEGDNPPQIGFYEHERDARFDRLTKLKPTRYFAGYFSEDDMWDHMAELGLVSNSVTLTFVDSREDIRYVYENGPDSCMSGNARNFNSDIHPTEAYASPDLQLAVLFRGDDLHNRDTQIIGRALCNRHTKEWVRVYGDIRRMEKLMIAEGYSPNSYCLGGCRLLKLFRVSNGKEQTGQVMAPYLDGECTSMELGDEFLHIIKPPILIYGGTQGYTDIPGRGRR